MADILNPKIEISSTIGKKWIRVEAVAVEDDRIEAKHSMLNAYPALQEMYKADDDLYPVLQLLKLQ